MLWGGTYLNATGRIIEDIIFDLDLSLLHPRSHTHYNFSHKTWSTLDLAITSPSLTSALEFFNHLDLAGSDNFPSIILRSCRRNTKTLPSHQNANRITKKQTGWNTTTLSQLILPLKSPPTHPSS